MTSENTPILDCGLHAEISLYPKVNAITKQFFNKVSLLGALSRLGNVYGEGAVYSEAPGG